MSSLCEDDSDDNDIFVVSLRKPVGKLTKEKALEIKKRVLDRESISSNERSINSSLNDFKYESSGRTTPVIIHEKRKVFDDDDDDDFLILEEKINKPVVNSDGGSDGKTLVKNNATPEKSPSKLISSYFTPLKKSPGGSTENSNDEKTSPSSDCDIKRKRMKSDSNNTVRINSSESQRKTRKNGDAVSSRLDNVIQGNSPSDNINAPPPRFFYSKSLKAIVHHELVKHALLEQKAAREGKKFGRLFTYYEVHDVENFFKLPENAFELYVRMLCRKKKWFRMSNIKYPDIQGNVNEIFMLLNAQNFVDIDITKESMETQMDLLNKTEVQILCKAFNIKVTGTKKEDYVEAIVNSAKNQRTVTEMWRGGSSGREKMMKTEIIRTLGPCMKLNDNFLLLLNRFFLLFSIPCCRVVVPSEDQKWQTQIHMMNQMNENNVRFPSYEVKPTVIFENRDDFTLYEKAMELMSRCDAAVLSKNNDEFVAIRQEAKVEFKKLLQNEGLKERVKNLPQFLRRYNAGSVYAKILTICCEKTSKKKNPKKSEEVVEVMEMLINQDSFSVGKRGLWYLLLVQAYLDMGETYKAATRLLTVLKEGRVSEIEQLQLQQKGTNLLKKKKNILGKGELRDELDDICTTDLTEASTVEIKARAMDSNEPGTKTVYMYKDEAGAINFTSVEDVVISHYKSNGFPKGIHDEGLLVQTMYLLVFFDIIYKLSPEGVFQSPYQTQPLDFLSESFYLNRKREIDSRLEEIRSWSVEKCEDVIKKVYMENYGVRCLITWSTALNPSLFTEVLMCLGVQQFAGLCERFARNFRVYRSGFPDLTVWNPLAKKCKFVEAKSPNDTLSANQRVWLHCLKKLNIDCEVCKVKNIASRSLRS